MPDHHPQQRRNDGPPTLDPDWEQPGPTRAPEHRAGRALERLAHRLAAPTVFVTGPTGTGKTALLQAWSAQSPGSVEWLTLAPSHRSPEVLRDALRVATAAAPAAIVIDDAHVVSGTPAEQQIEQFVTDASGAASVIICARSTPAFAAQSSLGSAEFITGRDLALRLDEIPEVFRAVHGRPLGLEQASAVLAETAGWPALVRLLAVAVHGYAPGGLDDAVAAAVGGDHAEAFFNAVTSELAPGLRQALSACSVAPIVTFGGATDAAGVEAASVLSAAIEDGTILTDHRAGAERRLPGALRRHLLRHLSPERRHELGVATARALLDGGNGDLVGAAASLHDSGCLPELVALLRREPDAFAVAGGMPWGLRMPERMLRDPLLRATRARALIDDRAMGMAREELAGIGDGDHPAASVRRTLLAEIDDGPARRRPAASVTASAAATRSAHDSASLIAAAAQRLRAGAVTEAVPLLTRSLHAPGGSRAATLSARIALTVARSATADTDEISAQLCAIEGEAVTHGLTGLARIARGALATAASARQSAVTAAVAECEERGDELGAAAVSGIDLIARLRDGRATPQRATELATRFAGLGDGAVAAWAEAAAALTAADHRHPEARRFVTAAESSGIREALPALRPLVDAARGLLDGDGELLRQARRAALAAGLPRLPSASGIRMPQSDAAANPAAPATRTPAVVSAREPRLTVICFGGFRMQVDGAELDLRGVRPQARALLRMLALNAGSPVHRELIAGILWGDLGTSSAVHALHVSISSLRRALSADTGSSPTEILERRGEAYALTLGERRSCDLVDFDRSLARATEANRHHDLDSATDALRGAVALYTGEVLPEDGPAEWAIGARDRYRLRAAGAASSLANLELRRGDTRAAVVAAERSVEIDPWLDDSWRTLVAVHRSSGDVVASQRAERAYHRMRVELGVE